MGRTFDRVTTVADLDLEVQEGEVFGFLGPNGAGKKTTVRIICCLIAPSGGRAFIAGNEVGREPDSMNIRAMATIALRASSTFHPWVRAGGRGS